MEFSVRAEKAIATAEVAQRGLNESREAVDRFEKELRDVRASLTTLEIRMENGDASVLSNWISDRKRVRSIEVLLASNLEVHERAKAAALVALSDVWTAIRSDHVPA